MLTKLKKNCTLVLWDLSNNMKSLLSEFSKRVYIYTVSSFQQRRESRVRIYSLTLNDETVFLLTVRDVRIKATHFTISLFLTCLFSNGVSRNQRIILYHKSSSANAAQIIVSYRTVRTLDDERKQGLRIF